MVKLTAYQAKLLAAACAHLPGVVLQDPKIMRVRKIDARNSLYGNFKYQIVLDVETFLNVRDWCHEIWGPAVEYHWWGKWGARRKNVNWSFDTQRTGKGASRSVIYLRDDTELTLFNLKWV